jgi:Right handed beta helix region
MRFTIVAFILLYVSVPVMSKIIQVAKSGGDYSTITAALNTTVPGDTVLVKGGWYNELITWPKSGSESGGYITLRAAGDSPVILDGNGLAGLNDTPEMILILDKSYIRIEGIEICNNITSSASVFNKGIQIEGTSGHIIVKKCKIYKIINNSNSESGGANAIGVFGRNASTPIRDIIIDSCEVFNNKTCYSEAVSLDGNVDGFRITNNYIHDNNNIGILIAGYYGECSNCGNDDQVRHGVISDNRVIRCSSCDNPAYKGDCSAGGIYSDGGGKTIIERNIVSECDIGIEAGAELSKSVCDSITIRDNLITNCSIGGIFTGGYETGLGWSQNVTIVNNTLYKNDTQKSGSGEILIQKARDIMIKNNILYSTDQKVAITKAFSNTYTSNVTVENNLFYSAAGASSIDGSSFDSKAKLADPLFVSETDFHLKENSPAIDGCASTYVPSEGELDLEKNKRLTGKTVDIGAYETNASSVLVNRKNGIIHCSKTTGIDIRKKGNHIKVLSHGKNGSFHLDGTLSTQK